MSAIHWLMERVGEGRVKCQVMLFKLIAFSVFGGATVGRGWLEKVASWIWPPDEQMGIVAL